MILRGLYGVWIVGWVACWIAFMSVFFTSWKTVFKQFRQLLNTSSTLGYLSSFSSSSYCNLDSFSTTRWIDWDFFWILDSFSIVGGSIELLFLYLMVYFSTLSSTDGLTPFDTSSVKIYWGSIYTSSCDPTFISFDLSLDSSLFSLPNNLISLQSWSLRFLQAFSRFYSLDKLLISHSSCISCFGT